ncbi:diacylglycerol kinase family protein [candidate division KSB1 bacterium]|nr:diacylglycerol kinase family protein [candidate division KSB1 bacterium]
MKKNSFIKRRLDSFRYAFNGIVHLFQTQHNAWIHASMTLIVILVGIFFNINMVEWLFITCAILIVWVAEGFNSALEYLADLVTHDQHPLIEKAKDIGAGSVLIAAFGSALIGIIIFLPYVIRFFD